MKGFHTFIVILLALTMTLAACGRRLPDEPVAETAPDTVAEEAVAEAGAEEATEAPAAEEATDEAVEEEAAEEVVEETPAEESVAVDTSDPFAVRVAEADPANGQTLYTTMNQTGFACSTCHLVDSESMLVGPGLLGIPTRAATRVEGETAPEYLYHSIAAPNDYVVEGYPEGVMPRTYTEVYTEDEIYDIVAYLMTLEDPSAAQAAPEPTAAPEEEVAEEEAVEEEVAAAEPTEEVTEDDADAEAATEEAVIVVEEDEEAQPLVVTATQSVIVVTATPTAEVVVETDEEEAPIVEQVDAEPDIVVTLASLGIARYGEEVFNREVIEGVSCADCHDVATGEYIDGPSLVNIEEQAAAAGVSPERFVYDAIINPEVHPDLSENYADALSSAEIFDVVAYLLSIESEGVEVEAAPEGEASAVEEPAAAGEEDTFAVAAAAADAAHGEELFNTMNSSGFMCATCHHVNTTDMLVGPGLLGIAGRAGERVEGQGAAEYLYNSILHTNDYIVEGYPASVMPAFYGDIYTEEEVYDLVAYLLTLNE